MTQQQCTKWVHDKLPILIKGKRGKVQYPFASYYAHTVIEEEMGKKLFELISELKKQ